MVREKKSMIGFDPLAWLEDEESENNTPDVEENISPKNLENNIKTEKDVISEELNSETLTNKGQQSDALESEAEGVLSDEAKRESVQDDKPQKEKKPDIIESKETSSTEAEDMQTESVKKSSTQSVIMLKAVQDISKVQDLKGEILVLIKDNDEIDIDGEAVERIDGSSLQLLCVLFDYAEHNALAVNWVKPSDALKQSVKILGMQDVLNLH